MKRKLHAKSASVWMHRAALLMMLVMIPMSKLCALQQNLITEEGAWCWFADPRSLHYENATGTINSTFIGYIDVHGAIKATQVDFLTGKRSEILIRSYFQPDDHDNPSFLVLPDERILIWYGRHTDEAKWYYRISQKPGDITTLGAEHTITLGANVTYPSPFIMSDDPDHIYMGWRGINWHPTLAQFSMPDNNDNISITWGPYQAVQSTGARPYVKYWSNKKDKIFMTFTTGHPDNEYPNWLYYVYFDVNDKKLHDIKGTPLSTVASGVFNVNKTTAFKTSYPNVVVDATDGVRDWGWQLITDSAETPYIAMVGIDNAKTTHNYYYVKWNGSSWTKTFVANGGPHFIQTDGLELCYSGGIILDPDDPHQMICSVPTAGANGTVYELYRYTLSDNGTSVVKTEQLTKDSKLNNARAYIIANTKKSPLRMIWMNGLYYDWIVSATHPQGYCTAAYCDYALPVENIDLSDALAAQLKNPQQGKTLLISSSEGSSAFTIAIAPSISSDAYYGTLVSSGNLKIAVGTDGKPVVTIGNKTYVSSNVLGSSDVWQTQPRGTSGNWPAYSKLGLFSYVITYDGSTIRTFVNGLNDQYIPVEEEKLTLQDVTMGNFKGSIYDCSVYHRVLNADEIKTYYNKVKSMQTQTALETLTMPTDVHSDIVLPSQLSDGTALTWTSSDENILTSNGVINFPSAAATVTMTATAGNLSRSFIVKVTPRNLNSSLMAKYEFSAADAYTNNGVTYVKDLSGNGRDVAVYGSAQVDGTLNLTANTTSGFSTNGYAIVPQGLIDSLRSYTILFKMRASALANAPRIYDFGSASSNSFFFRPQALAAGIKYNGGTTTMINGTTVLQTGKDYRVAVTYSASTKKTSIYLDGVLAAEGTANIVEPYQLISAGADTRNYIGRTQWNNTSYASSNVDFSGLIDSFYVYDISLSQQEIVQLQIPAVFNGIHATATPSPLPQKFRGIYSLTGQTISRKSTNTSLPSGVYLVNGKRVSVK